MTKFPSNSSCIPSPSTYLEIFREIMVKWSDIGDCFMWAQPPWATTFISYMVLILTLFYIYVITLMIANRSLNLKNSFYQCAILLFFGDIVILISSVKEGVVQGCILNNDPARHLAWQTIGTWGMELILATNLTLAAVRFTTITWGQDSSKTVAKYGMAMSLTWSICMTTAHQFGYVTRIWYDGDSNYQDEHLFPFNILRIPILFSEIVITLILYIASLVRLKMIGRATMNNQVFKRETRFLVQSLFIFVNELVFLYSTFWFGLNYLGLGSSSFNANLNYWARPITTGSTPILYMIFSSAVRKTAASTFPMKQVLRSSRVSSFVQQPRITVTSSR